MAGVKSAAAASKVHDGRITFMDKEKPIIRQALVVLFRTDYAAKMEKLDDALSAFDAAMKDYRKTDKFLAILNGISTSLSARSDRRYSLLADCLSDALRAYAGQPPVHVDHRGYSSTRYISDLIFYSERKVTLPGKQQGKA